MTSRRAQRPSRRTAGAWRLPEELVVAPPPPVGSHGMGSPPGLASKPPHVILGEGLAHISAQLLEIAQLLEQVRAELTRQSHGSETASDAAGPTE